MQSSFLKQFIYGVIFLGIIFAIGYLLVIGTRSAPTCFDGRQNQSEEGVDCGGPCASCEIKTLKPIQTLKVTNLDSGNNKLSSLIELKNPNVSFGADNFTYKINFYGIDEVLISSIQKNSFIYPGEIKTITEPGLDINPNSVRKTDIEIINVSWKPISEFSKPRTQTRDIQVKQKDNGRLVVSGLFANENSFSLRRVVVVTIVLNQFGLPVGVSKTLLQDVGAFQEKNFSVIVPNIFLTDVTRNSVRIFIEAQ